jgi:copper chaperone NosL
MSEGTATLLPEAPTAAPPRVPVVRMPVAADRGPRMRRGSRLGAAVAALALGALYLTPLWHIGLTAPQYPEGLGMYIWVSRITGEKPQDLNSINGLNHYIGMKTIVPESIPELRLLPVVVAAAVIVGLLVALIGRRSALYAWTAVFAAASAAGLADFWRWGYDYGHNLDPHAAIRIPGMSYQPPLLGDKQLLNFHATSWPAMGGWIAILVLAVLVALSVTEWRSARARAG